MKNEKERVALIQAKSYLSVTPLCVTDDVIYPHQTEPRPFHKNTTVMPLYEPVQC